MHAEGSRSGPSAHDRSSQLGLAVSFWILIPIILFVVHWMQIFESFGVVGCEGDCDLELSFGARALYPWAVGASVIAAVVAAAVFRLRGKPVFWGPLFGVALILLSAIGTSIVFQVGLAPMRERNDRITNGEAPAEVSPPLPDPTGAWEASADGAPFLWLFPGGTGTVSDRVPRSEAGNRPGSA